jgi:hypothetical protein
MALTETGIRRGATLAWSDRQRILSDPECSALSVTLESEMVQ